jgi:putative FmdB family regulatory protein
LHCQDDIIRLVESGRKKKTELRMPIYAYKCPDCGQDFEKLTPQADRDLPVICIKCGAKNIRRSMASFAAAIGSASKSPGCGGGSGFS